MRDVGSCDGRIRGSPPSGTYDSLNGLPTVALSFTPGSSFALVTLDDAGFPADEDFAVFNQPVELFVNGVLVLSGRNQGSIRHFID